MDRFAPLLLVLSLAACTTTDTTAPEPNPAGVMAVDASASWAYVSLEDSATVSPTPSATASTEWDIGFSTTSVAINGGTAGPAGMTAYCICQNASKTNEQFLAATAEGEKADFDAVTSVPASAVFSADVFANQRWYRYNLAGDNRVTPTFDVYLLKRGTTVYKVQITNYYGPTGAPRQISFRFERIAQ
jgi:hypothetical protein